MIEVANNPAGRLRTVFNHMHAQGNSHTVLEWWKIIQKTFAPRSDVYAVRAEVAALLRDVDTAIATLPTEDDPDSYRGLRPAWSRGVFNWQLNVLDNAGNGQQYSAEAIISLEDLRWLTPLSSLLDRDAPEVSTTIDDESDEVYERIRDNIQTLLDDVYHAGSEIPTSLRSQLLTLLMRAQDDIEFLYLRGWKQLYRSTATVEGVVTAIEQAEEIRQSEPILSKVQGWIETAREICVDVERIIVPAATGITIAITSGDVATALGAGIAARTALETASGRGRSFRRDALPPAASNEAAD